MTIQHEPIDLARTVCYEDGFRVVFHDHQGQLVAAIVSHRPGTPLNVWDVRSVASLFLYHGSNLMESLELLPDGRALNRQRIATGQDFAMLLDLAIAAGLILPESS